METATTPTASTVQLLKATIAALLVAIVVLIAFILPSEYGVDPLGTGAALGLTDLAAADTAAAGNAIPADIGINNPMPRKYKVDLEELVLAPGQGTELKYHMEKGTVMLYSWTSTAPVLFEFHGEPDVKPNKDYYDSYELDDKVGKAQSNGSFTAPSTGIHGWFWENKTDKPVEVRLTTAGFYSKAIYFGASGPEDIEVPDVE
jgi:hypothetical protein